MYLYNEEKGEREQMKGKKSEKEIKHDGETRKRRDKESEEKTHI